VVIQKKRENCNGSCRVISIAGLTEAQILQLELYSQKYYKQNGVDFTVSKCEISLENNVYFNSPQSKIFLNLALSNSNKQSNQMSIRPFASSIYDSGIKNINEVVDETSELSLIQPSTYLHKKKYRILFKLSKA